MPPNLLRKVVIFAAVDGLILQSSGNGLRYNANNEPSIRIDYKTNRITSFSGPASDLGEKKDLAGLETYGLVGLLTVASYSFLITITQRQQVAQIHNKPVYAIANVAVIPTSSQADATRAITQATEGSGPGIENDESDTASEASEISDTDTEEGDVNVKTVPTSPVREAPHSRADSISSNITENMVRKRLRFGRFAANWLSRKAMGLPGLGTAELNMDTETVEIPLVTWNGAGDKIAARSASAANVEEQPAEPENDDKSPAPKEEAQPPTTTKPIELLPKLLRYTKLIFSSRNFFFSYDYDLTRPITAQASASNGHLPLHKVADELYFWNRNLMTPFATAGAHHLILPLIQGFVGQSEFTIAAKPNPSSPETNTEARILGAKEEAEAAQAPGDKRNFLLTLISRRSVKRPGLRYLRRGVDDDGNTANSVETEQILSVPDWDPSRNIYSYLQVRGSIPLYFSQSPYSFKPVPILHHSSETNQFAFERHFRDLSRRYGKVQCISLVDKRAPEIKIGEQYKKYAQYLNEAGGIDGVPLGFEWFDFHNECRGMKFENVSRLVDRLAGTLDEFKYAILNNGTVLQSPTGILRTNCMDCLDRTGVAQCAFGQWALERELKEEGIDVNNLGGDSATSWFNILWADNGDAISKQYSSTAALKGDYTRTKKRDYRGALNDFGLTLSRYYNNIVNDYFSQACIDYLLGNVSTHVFQEFMTELQTADPGISVQKLRQNAIDTSCRIVISDPSEEFLGGWAILTPRQPNTLRTLPFEESVLLLTDAAVYSCRFDWNTDKVLSFERIDLRSIARIKYGTYITSTLTDSQSDEQRNVGLLIEFREGDNNALRVNTRTLQSNVDPKNLENNNSNNNNNNEWDVSSWFTGSRTSATKTRIMAFKALPLSNSVTQTQRRKSAAVSEIEWVRTICEEIERAMRAGEKALPSHPEPSPSSEPSSDDGTSPPSVVEASDIISLADAKKRTGLLEHLVHDLKKMVWA
ncbi:SacI homology domain-containing protein [Aspergillus egyptiacus]|nr:SacI homology domain-containing protein [Aspergillus egyptiacus]